MTDIAEDLLQKLRTLPPQRLAEVVDFVDFLRLREQQARAQKIDALFATMDQLAALDPPMSPEEIQVEVDAVRRERREQRDAAGR